MMIQEKVKERPILFTGEMVRAILEGRKTVTRRVLKFPSHVPSWKSDEIASVNPDGKDGWIGWSPHPVTDEQSKKFYPNGGGFKCPYGRPGDLLWVRETWQAQNQSGEYWHEVPKDERPLYNWALIDKAEFNGAEPPPKWQSPYHMYKWMARLWLRVKDVRVERVQDITENDVLVEGVTVDRVAKWLDIPWSELPTLTDAFTALWDSINAKRGHSWESNPFVWVVEFEKVETYPETPERLIKEALIET